MTKFIRMDDDSIVPVRCITRVKPGKVGFKSVVEWFDGEEARTSRTDHRTDEDDLYEPIIVPAAPGFSVVGWFENEDGTREPRLVPIIAWEICTGPVCSYPITPDSDFPDRLSLYTPAVLYPDGRVVCSGEACYDSLDDYVQHARAKE